MKHATARAVELASCIEWSVGGCDHVSVRRNGEGVWRVFDSRGVRQGARLVSEHASLDSAVAAGWAALEGR